VSPSQRPGRPATLQAAKPPTRDAGPLPPTAPTPVTPCSPQRTYATSFPPLRCPSCSVGHTWDQPGPAAGHFWQLLRSEHATGWQRYPSVNHSLTRGGHAGPDARLLPILLPSPQPAMDRRRQAWNVGPGDSHSWTAVDGLPISTDLRVNGRYIWTTAGRRVLTPASGRQASGVAAYPRS
jgi:hypothetical protein